MSQNFKTDSQEKCTSTCMYVTQKKLDFHFKNATKILHKQNVTISGGIPKIYSFIRMKLIL